MLRQDLLGEMLEEYYAASEENSAFWRLVDSFSGERNDDAIMQLIQKLYDVSRSHPWPEHWLRATASMFGPPASQAYRRDVPDEADCGSARGAALCCRGICSLRIIRLWEQSLIRDLSLELEGAADLLRQAQQHRRIAGRTCPVYR